MLIGGAAGLAMDLLIVLPIARNSDTSSSINPLGFLPNPLGFLPLIAVGALIGGLIGSAFRK